MKPKTRVYLNITGAILALLFITGSIMFLGVLKFALFVLFLSLALQDARTGKIYVITYIPIVVLLLVFFFTPFTTIFVNIFGVLLLVWSIVGILQIKIKAMDKTRVYFGFGDVLGVPYAVTLSYIFAQVIGIMMFGIGIVLVIPWLVKKKQIRFLPYLIPGVLLALISGMVLA